MKLTATLLIILVTCLHTTQAQRLTLVDTTTILTNKEKAIQLFAQLDTLQQSPYWPMVQPKAFANNVKKNVLFPLQVQAGKGTNFCAFAAVLYTCLHNEPNKYVTTMLQLYRTGTATYRKVHLHPKEVILQTAGTIQFSGALDLNVADQMWFFSLAHKFKGYLNTFNLTYNPGDENTLWAATNLAKFNRMLRKLCKYKVWSRGSDLVHPKIRNVIPYITDKLQQGEVYLYLNNGILRKKNHNKIKKQIPTHFVVLQKINYNHTHDLITLRYWDGGTPTQLQLTTIEFKKILYGISYTKYKYKVDEN